MKIRAIKTQLFSENTDLVSFISKNVRHIRDKSILVIASKVVAISEGSIADPRDRDELIEILSDTALKTKYVSLTLANGMLSANAGIDDSNANGVLILPPKDAAYSARALHTKLKKHYKLKNLGIVITDSNPVPLRAGVMGFALGYAGFLPVRDYRGTKDLYGRKFVFSQTNVADSLATAANLVMGEGAERQPLAIISDAPVTFTGRALRKLSIDPSIDMYAPLLGPLLKRRKRS